ncbi:MAG: right-handed parallel beta-helix repeat-containing protein [Methylocapsa sp.]|nr:right-handed parallel beta-helix repeat-containing protein [Methylocapsa sp.]
MKVTHCTVQGYATGISLAQTAPSLIADTIVTDNGTAIILATDVAATLNHVLLFGNQTGVEGATELSLIIADTVASNNGTGFSSGLASFVFVRSTITKNTMGIFSNAGNLTLANSTITRNGTGILLGTGSAATSFGDNHIKGNFTAEVKGGIPTNIGTQ